MRSTYDVKMNHEIITNPKEIESMISIYFSRRDLERERRLLEEQAQRVRRRLAMSSAKVIGKWGDAAVGSSKTNSGEKFWDVEDLGGELSILDVYNQIRQKHLKEE
jgi:hypothetical protein